MIEEQKLSVIEIKELVQKVTAYRDAGWRLVQIGATRTEVFELNYSFDKEYHFENLRIVVSSQDVKVPSVSSVYWCAFLYENEIHDLFGISFEGIVVDYAGKFYRTAVAYPFGEKK